MTSKPISVDDGFFNDLSRQPNKNQDTSNDSQERDGSCENGEEQDIPKTKRIACVICRKRKLKCDGGRPKCATCARLGHSCAYDEVRRKSGPKRGYVKALEARLAQVETQLKTKVPMKSKPNDSNAAPASPKQSGMSNTAAFGASDSMGMQIEMQQETMLAGQFAPSMQTSTGPFPLPLSSMAPEVTPDFLPGMNLEIDDSFSWEMIGLGLEEPMPMQEAVDELTQIYFDKIHPSLPMLHKYRYQASMSLAPNSRPPICLRYAMWANAANITEKYMHHHEIFYRRARKYMELDEMKGSGEAFSSVAHAQCLVLFASYEFKMMYFPRAWMSAGKACRLVNMMGLNRLDGVGLDVKQCLPPVRDWTEREERRRVFWMAYCVDRYASIGTGWPMVIDERDIMTNLPASEDAYESSTPQDCPTMKDAMTHQQVATLSSFAGVVFISHFFGLNLTHLHRPEPDEKEDDLQGKFWKRHRNMDNILLNTSLSLPSHLRLPAGIRSPNTVFLNFAIHTSTICLHQAAIFKAEKNRLPTALIDQSRTRCILAAAEIATIMRLTSHLDVAGMNPFMAFCLYVSARVFVQYLKRTPKDPEIRSSLEFLITAMQALKRKNPLTESFLVQLKLDIESSGLDVLPSNPDQSTLYKDSLRESASPSSQFSKGLMRSCASPRPNIRDYSSSEGPTPEDVRFPEWRGEQTGSTIGSESPHQTQYSLRNIEIASRDTRPLHPTLMEQEVVPQGLNGIFPSQGWSERFTSNEPTGMNPIMSNNISNGTFDTEMSENTTQSSNTSTGLTPQSTTSYHSSSNTEYTPPQVQDESNGPSASMPMNFKQTSFSPQQSSGTGKSHGNGQEDPFKIPPGWENSTGLTPSGYSVMSPGEGWEKMMQGMSWDGQSG